MDGGAEKDDRKGKAGAKATTVAKALKQPISMLRNLKVVEDGSGKGESSSGAAGGDKTTGAPVTNNSNRTPSSNQDNHKEQQQRSERHKSNSSSTVNQDPTTRPAKRKGGVLRVSQSHPATGASVAGGGSSAARVRGGHQSDSDDTEVVTPSVSKSGGGRRGKDKESAEPASASDEGTTATGHKWGEKGTQFRKGKFSDEESQLVMKSVEAYSEEHNITPESLCSEGKDAHVNIRGAWLQIAMCLPDRPVQSIYRHAVRQVHRNKKKGPWTAEEKDNLASMVKRDGRKWAKIGAEIGRSADSCRDKYREMQDNEEQDSKCSKWTPDEEKKLLHVIRSMAEAPEEAPLKSIKREMISWNNVAKEIPNRTRLMCLRKFDSLLGAEVRTRTQKGDTEFGQIEGPEGPDDPRIPRKLRSDFGLLTILKNIKANHESEVVWYRVAHSRPNARWKELCRVEGVSDLPFKEQVEALMRRTVSLIHERGGGVWSNGERLYADVPTADNLKQQGGDRVRGERQPKRPRQSAPAPKPSTSEGVKAVT